MTEQEARQRAEAAADTLYTDNLLGRVARAEAVEVATRALMALDSVRCAHEPYQGRCAHYDVRFSNGRAVA